MRLHFAHWRHEDNLALQLAFETGVHVCFVLRIEVNDLGRQRMARLGNSRMHIFLLIWHRSDFGHYFDRRRPRFWISDHRNALRLDHLRAESLQRPTTAEWPPRFEVRVLQSPPLQRLARPVVRALHVG
jgi:hypothetical protein